MVNGYKEMYKDPLTNQFREDASFEDIYELYRLDHELRSIFIKYILIVIFYFLLKKGNWSMTGAWFYPFIQMKMR